MATLLLTAPLSGGVNGAGSIREGEEERRGGGRVHVWATVPKGQPLSKIIILKTTKQLKR